MKRLGKQKAYLVCTLIMSVFITVLSGCGGGGGGEWKAPPGTSTVTVTSTDPANTEIGVFRNTKISATFSGTVDSASLTTATFVVKQGTTVVPGTVNYTPITAVFTPEAILAANTQYTATITTGVRDSSGKYLANDYQWKFTTGDTSNAIAPSVIDTINANGAFDVPINTKVGATFSVAMDPTTITTTTFTLKQGATPVSGTAAYSGRNAVFTPAGNLTPNKLYTATITTGAKDLAGNALASDYVWSWTTAATTDLTPPKVTVENPADLATDVAISSVVRATFDKAMDPLTINTLNVTLKAGSASVNGQVTYDAPSKVATFKPAIDLLPNTKYTATVTTGAKDLTGNALAPGLVPNPWTFTTAATIVVPPVLGKTDLLTAATYGTFGGSAGMTNTGTLTQILGDIGSIATGTDKVTGFHDSLGDIYTETPANIGAVSGVIYTCTNSTTGPTSTGTNATSCGKATQARLDAEKAYLALAAKATTADPGENLGGKTLAPGVYKTTSGKFLITGSDLTLDAKGDANAEFVFQTATSLTVGASGAPRSIILIGGAQAKNVFWQVGSAAIINPGGGGTMAGTIISQAGAAFSTVGSVNIITLEGRALSLGASVTLVNTVIKVPAP